MEILLAQYLPLIIKYAIIPTVASIVRAQPTITDEEIHLKLPADLQALATLNQSFLDSIRTQAGR